MLIDPKIIAEHWIIILTLSALTILGKFFSTSIGTLISGQSLKVSVQTGMSVAQIGEFSFIIATLGLTLGVTSDFLYPIAVSVSAVTTFTTPYLIKLSEPFYNLMLQGIPAVFIDHLDRYRTALNSKKGSDLIGFLWRAHGIKIVLNSVIVVSIALAFDSLAERFILESFGPSPILDVLIGASALTLSLPFLWAIVFSRSSFRGSDDELKFQQLRSLQLGVVIVKVCIVILLIGYIVSQFSSFLAVSGFVLLSIFLLFLLLSRYAETFYKSIESIFYSNLNDSDINHSPKVVRQTLAPWDATLTEVLVSPDSKYVAKSLLASAIKERFGITIALIERGSQRILAPKGEDLLLPFDRLHVIGTDEQLEKMQEEFVETTITSANLFSEEQVGLDSILLSPHSSFINQPIRDCNLREIVHGLIVGVERNGKRILSPDASFILESGDLVWIVGDRLLIKKLIHGGLAERL